MIIEFQQAGDGIYQLHDMIGKRITDLSITQQLEVYISASKACSSCSIECAGMGGVTKSGQIVDVNGKHVLFDGCSASELPINLTE